jgi:hypothetical protein
MTTSPNGKGINEVNRLRASYRDAATARCVAYLDLAHAISLIRARVASIPACLRPGGWNEGLSGIAGARAQLSQLGLNIEWVSTWLREYDATIQGRLAAQDDLLATHHDVMSEASACLDRYREWRGSAGARILQQEQQLIEVEVAKHHGELLAGLEKERSARALKSYLRQVEDTVNTFPSKLLTLPSTGGDQEAWAQTAIGLVIATHSLVQLLPVCCGSLAEALGISDLLRECVDACLPALERGDRNLAAIFRRRVELNRARGGRFSLAAEPSVPVPSLTLEGGAWGDGGLVLPGPDDCGALTKLAFDQFEAFMTLEGLDDVSTSAHGELLVRCETDESGKVAFFEVRASITHGHDGAPLLETSSEEMRRDVEATASGDDGATSVDRQLQRFRESLEQLGHAHDGAPIDDLHAASLAFEAERQWLKARLATAADASKAQVEAARVELRAAPSSPQPEFLPPLDDAPASLLPTPREILTPMLEIAICFNPMAAGVYHGLNLLTGLLIGYTLLGEKADGWTDKGGLVLSALSPVGALVSAPALRVAKRLADVLRTGSPALLRDLRRLYISGRTGVRALLTGIERVEGFIAGLPILGAAASLLKRIDELGDTKGRAVTIALGKMMADKVIMEGLSATARELELLFWPNHDGQVEVEIRLDGVPVDAHGDPVTPGDPASHILITDPFPATLDPLWK